MQRSDFHFELPEELIAQVPLAERTASRLLVVEADSLSDQQFTDITGLLRPGDLLVFNNTRVIPARLHGNKDSGGKVEVLVERVLDERRVLAHVRASKSPKPGTTLLLEDHIEMEMLGRQGELFELAVCGTGRSVISLLEEYGHMPLPPYIERADTADDSERYQTVYAQHAGAVAAPTAGLHFDQAMLDKLDAMGVQRCEVTLHVGAGTFQPVRVDNIEEHHMHSEWIEVSQQVVDAVRQTREKGGRVVAIGTTSVRSLESAAMQGELSAFRGDSDIFIYPGYEFQVVDCMLTNFHLPESTLIMLVSAFAGYDNIMQAYKHAVEQRYRFFSYGDAMFMCKNEA